MASEWKCHEVRDLIAEGKLFIGDGYRAKNEELSFTGLPFARAGNINNGFRFERADCFPAENLARVGDKVSQSGDVVFTSKGTVGRFAFVQDETPRFVYSPQLCFWRSFDQDNLYPRFLYYWMFGREFFTQFKGVAGQTDMAEYVSLSDQRRMHITIPPVVQQRAIVHILGTLDDKIELNRRMNETLEGIVRAIFKSWFVDFDPVRAKAEGRDPSLPKPIADLFPDSFEGSELGEIPKGWKICLIGDLSEVVGGSTPSTTGPEFWEGGRHCWATPKDLASLKSPVLLDTERRITDVGLRQISSGLLPVGTVLFSSRAPIGYLAIAEIPTAINQGFIAMKPRKEVPNHFLLLWARFAHEEILSRANGSTFLEISKANFRPIPLVRPDERALAVFERISRPLYQRIVSNESETQNLVGLRDTLLPKLISGELLVRDAERFIGRAV